jgi:hypothetical protein
MAMGRMTASPRRKIREIRRADFLRITFKRYVLQMDGAECPASRLDASRRAPDFGPAAVVGSAFLLKVPAVTFVEACQGIP